MVAQNMLRHPLLAKWVVQSPSSSELDLRDPGAVRRYFFHHKPDAVIHAAGVVGGIQANIQNPLRFLADNTLMGVNVVAACVDCRIELLINIASSCMYPRAIGSGLTENDILSGPLESTNEGYALAKIVTMRMCEYAVREKQNLIYRTLVPCNLYGKWDKFDDSKSHLLAAIIKKISHAKATNSRSVEVWGDGMARREFMYASDFAEAILMAVEDPLKIPEVMNVGVGHDYTVNEYYNIAANVIGWSGDIVHNMSKPVGMARKLLDVSRQIQWGWYPKTSIEDGIRETYSYYKELKAK